MCNAQLLHTSAKARSDTGTPRVASMSITISCIDVIFATNKNLIRTQKFQFLVIPYLVCRYSQYFGDKLAPKTSLIFVLSANINFIYFFMQTNHTILKSARKFKSDQTTKRVSIEDDRRTIFP
jgi:thioredoxin-related protein